MGTSSKLKNGYITYGIIIDAMQQFGKGEKERTNTTRMNLTKILLNEGSQT